MRKHLLSTKCHTVYLLFRLLRTQRHTHLSPFVYCSALACCGNAQHTKYAQEIRTCRTELESSRVELLLQWYANKHVYEYASVHFRRFDLGTTTAERKGRKSDPPLVRRFMMFLQCLSICLFGQTAASAPPTIYTFMYCTFVGVRIQTHVTWRWFTVYQLEVYVLMFETHTHTHSTYWICDDIFFN